MSHWGKLIALNILFILFFNKYKIFNICISRKEVTNFKEPLNIEILSIIYGSLLGDGHAEKRLNGKGTRISFYQESSHTDYLLYLHSLIANLGYCNTNIPKIFTRLSKKGKIIKCIRFSTWTYDQFNNIHQAWYIKKDNQIIKILPRNISHYLTPLALAIWIMNDGGISGKGLKIATNNFTYDEIKILNSLLFDKYKIKSSIHKTGKDNQYNLYILSESMSILTKIVKPYIISSMKYKFGNYI